MSTPQEQARALAEYIRRARKEAATLGHTRMIVGGFGYQIIQPPAPEGRYPIVSCSPSGLVFRHDPSEVVALAIAREALEAAQ